MGRNRAARRREAELYGPEVPDGWSHVDTSVPDEEQVSEDQETLEDYQRALDEEGVDPAEDLVDDVIEDLGEAGFADDAGLDDDAAFLAGLQELERTCPIQDYPPPLLARVIGTIAPPPPRIHGPDPVPRMTQEQLDQRIRIVSASCPKKPGSKAEASWSHYVDGMTVSAYLASHGRRQARRDLAWNVEKGFVRLQDPAEWAAEQRGDFGDE